MDRTKLSPTFFAPLIDKAVELIDPWSITLFGSFARGDAREKSDIDLAFSFSGEHAAWIEFKGWVEEHFRTLREVDLVDLSEASDDMIKSVKREGIILYERKNSQLD